jgi:predicted ATP-grasp superfamily ATP-dependent carboligase
MTNFMADNGPHAPIRKLAIIGASARAAAFSALRAGYEVTAADLFADADLKRGCSTTRISDYPEGFSAWLARTDCDAWLYTGALENYPRLLDRLASIKPLLGNAGDIARRARDPLVLQQLLREEGLAFPETRRALEAAPLDGSWLAKTYRGASGTGVWLLDSEPARARAHEQHAFAQRRVEGVPAAAVYVLSEHEARLIGVTQQIVGDPRLGAKRWQYAGSIGPLAVSSPVKSQLEQLGGLLQSRLHLRGLVGVDVIIADDRLWHIEINPRYTASLEVIERFSGIHALAAHVAACQSSSAHAQQYSGAMGPHSMVHGKAILFAKQDATISPALHEWAMERSGGETHRHTSLADIPAAGEHIAAGHPVLTALISAPPSEYDERMSLLLSTIESKLYPA